MATTTDPSKYNGKFQLVSSENFDDYMKALGVNIALRAIGNTIKPALEFQTDGETWTIHMNSTFKSSTDTFKLNQELDEETLDGRKVKTTFTLEDGKLVQRQKAIQASDKDSTIIREWPSRDELITTCLVDDVVCVRRFKRVN